MMGNNPLAAVFQMARSGKDPMPLIQQLAQSNPAAAQVLQMMQGKNPEQLHKMAINMAKERGIPLEQAAQMFGVRLPK